MEKLLQTFLNKKNLKISKCKGIYFYDFRGNKYTDLTGGYTGHAILGWNNNKILTGIKRQLKKFCHIDYKVFNDPNREKLANLILKNKENTLDKVFLVGSSGAEACEAAMKISYQYFFSKGLRNKRFFISRKQSYHGCSTHSLSLGDRPNLNFYKNILSKNCFHISEHNYLRHKKNKETEEAYSKRSAQELENKILKLGPDNVCAFVVETIAVGLIGDVPPSKNYLKYVRRICDKYDVHLILDEVWCGTGTSGKSFCFDWDGITPDFIFISKTLAAGYGALSAVITKNKITNKIYQKFGQINYSNTHQGHSLSVAAAVEVQKIIQKQNFLKSVHTKGKYFRSILESELKNNDFFYNVRGRGMRNSFEYKTPNNQLFGSLLKNYAFEKKIFLDAKWHRVAFPVSLTITKKEIDKNLEIFISLFKKIQSNWPKYKNIKTKQYIF